MEQEPIKEEPRSSVAFLHGELNRALKAFEHTPTPVGAVLVVRQALLAGVLPTQLGAFPEELNALIARENLKHEWDELTAMVDLLADMRVGAEGDTSEHRTELTEPPKPFFFRRTETYWITKKNRS